MTFLEHLEDRGKGFLFRHRHSSGRRPWLDFQPSAYGILAKPLTQYLPEGTRLAYTTLTALLCSI
jgi:hypothetical protein